MDDLRTIRAKLGITQAAFADALGLHQSTISRMETGELDLDKRTLLAATALLSAHDAATQANQPSEPASSEAA